MKTITKIIKMRKEYETPNKALERNVEQQSRLKLLVDTYGEEVTCAATGYTVNTLRHHLKRKNPTSINADRIDRAEEILSKVM